MLTFPSKYYFLRILFIFRTKCKSKTPVMSIFFVNKLIKKLFALVGFFIFKHKLDDFNQLSG